MNPIIKALEAITKLFYRLEVPYMVFGGIANSIYGNPRQTFDIDIKFFLKSDNDLEQFLDNLSEIGEIIPADSKKFIEETNVIPIDIQGVRVDLVFAELPFEREAINRSKSMSFFDVNIKVCTPEDLIIQKAVSIREKDWFDINYITENLRDELDWPYLLKHCRDLAELLDDPDIYSRIKRNKNEKEI